VSLPPVAPDQIRGIEVVRRAPWQVRLQLTPSPDTPPDAKARSWRLGGQPTGQPPPAGTDVAAPAAGHIAVVPMHLDDHHAERLAAAPRWQGQLPAWQVAPAPVATP
jgi:broad specificity polyphosphatase/5'/3'-nucleotidase SurE